jgi:asparagine synthase (glutamine-hydrolysing)
MPFMYDAGLGRRALPDEFLIGGKGGKAVLRAAMDKVLPREIVRRKKIGFRVATGD